MGELIIGIIVIFALCCFLSNIGFIIWNKEFYDIKGNEKWKYIITVIGFLFLLFFLGYGFERAFDFFLPKRWGNFDEDGEFVTFSYSISVMLSTYASVGILHIVMDYLEKVKRLEHLEAKEKN